MSVQKMTNRDEIILKEGFEWHGGTSDSVATLQA